MNLKTWLHAERGRQVRLARHLGIRPPQVADWISGDKPVPLQHAAGIEQFTEGEVTRREMFPTTWKRIWPELDTPPTPTPAPLAQGAQQETTNA